MTNEELARRIAAGEDNLSLDLWKQIEKFVHWQANRFFFGYQDRCKQLSIELDDLRQEGYLAMMKAVEKFDPSRGTKFLTLFGYILKQQFFRMARMDYKGWEHNAVYACESLDALALTGDCLQRIDRIGSDEEDFERVDEEIYWTIILPVLADALEALTARQHEVISALYYEKSTREAAAKRFGVSKGAINTIVRGGLKKLRSNADLLAACAC